MLASKRLAEDNPICFSPKVKTPDYKMPTQAPTPAAAPTVAPTGIQFGGQNEKTTGMTEAKVDNTPTQDKSTLTVAPNAPSEQTNTAGSTGGATNVSTAETQKTAFDKLKQVQRVKGGAFSGSVQS